MKLKLNDKILVITGKDKGKTGKIIKVLHKHNRIVVEKINMRTKHIKKTTQAPGQKITFEAPMNASNVMILDPTLHKPTRIGYKKLENGRKERISKLSGASLDNIVVEAETKPVVKKTAEGKTSKSKKTIVKA
jgi:large subunit ribosomal protein L24